jgi:hypothetical protein
MKIVKVEYQVMPEFVEVNKQNIEKVMQGLKQKNIQSMKYASYYLGEGRFMHFNITAGENFSELNELPEFKNFQAALKASQPISAPKASDLSLVGANFDLV